MSKSNHNPRRKKLSHRLVHAREAAGLSQKAVEKTGIISQTELSKIENGTRKVDFLLLEELAKLYLVDISFFVTF